MAKDLPELDLHHRIFLTSFCEDLYNCGIVEDHGALARSIFKLIEEVIEYEQGTKEKDRGLSAVL